MCNKEKKKVLLHFTYTKNILNYFHRYLIELIIITLKKL